MAGVSERGFPASASRAQQRLLAHVQQQCAAFVSSVRAAGKSGGSDVGTSVLDVLSSFRRVPSLPHAPPSTSAPLPDDGLDPLQTGLPALELPPYCASTTAVPLVARRVALPEDLHAVPLLSVLPPDVAARYATAATGFATLLRTPDAIRALDAADPLAPPRIAGTRAEYVALIARMILVGMIAFTDVPLAVNGVFAVEKDADADRLIIDARPANRLFVESPPVQLCDPSHLVQLQVPAGAALAAGKSDLSNFYHHLELPAWLQPFFALPALTDAELAQLGLDVASCGGRFPMCRTLPMGFSHAVFLAQQAHLHVLSRSAAVQSADNLVALDSPVLSAGRVVIGVVIDDFFVLSTDRLAAQRVFDGALAAYAAAGFVVKPSKVVPPTTQTVKIIGFDVGGPDALVCLPPASALALLRDTLAVLTRGTCTGRSLAHLIGRWTWCMLLRRPSLAALQRVYRFIEVADRRRFALWPSVRRELWQLLGLAPLLQMRLGAEVHHRVLASDASTLAAGVVSAALPSLERDMWSLCLSRRSTVAAGAQLPPHSQVDSDPELQLCPPSCAAPVADAAATRRLEAHTAVLGARWTRVLSSAWRWGGEHINALELRAVLLSLHWLLSYPSALGRRAYLLVDSMVALFSLWKGRSSSPSLLLVLRKISALLLAGGVTLLVGWVPSEVNPADDASRLRGSESGELGSPTVAAA